MKKSQQQSGSAHIVIIIVLVVAIIGLLGFIVWNNYLKAPAESTTTQTTQEQTSSEEATSAKTEGEYVLINPWGVRFLAPTDGTTVTGAQFGTTADVVGFITSNLTPSEVCSAANGAAGSIERSRSELSGEVTGATISLINNGEPLNGYYYAFSLPNGDSCEDRDPSDYEEAVRLQELSNTLVEQ